MGESQKRMPLVCPVTALERENEPQVSLSQKREPDHASQPQSQLAALGDIIPVKEAQYPAPRQRLVI